ncbi:MAG: hypothetical protein LBK27_02590 [Treponema sp.]|nr:hypothetical protein [Treponema sp.]
MIYRAGGAAALSCLSEMGASGPLGRCVHPRTLGVRPPGTAADRKLTC